MITNTGLFWRRDKVFWGAGSQPGKLLGVPSGAVTQDAIDFREQVGIYVLYAGYEAIYVGQTAGVGQRLLHRLKNHQTDDLAERWDRFSWFGLCRVLASGQLAKVTQAAHPALSTALNHMEALLIHALEPPMNKQGGRFGQNVTRYLQKRDDRLGLTVEEMIKELWESSP